MILFDSNQRLDVFLFLKAKGLRNAECVGKYSKMKIIVIAILAMGVWRLRKRAII